MKRKEMKNFLQEMFMRIMLCYAASSWLFVLSLNEMHTILFFVLILVEISLQRYTWNGLSSISQKLKKVNNIIPRFIS